FRIAAQARTSRTCSIRSRAELPASSEASGPDAIERSREGDRLPHVVQSADPADGPLHAEAEARVRDAAVTPQIEVPAEHFLLEAVPQELRAQALDVILALPTA